jgi:AcrR family transcriptional regulator
MSAATERRPRGRPQARPDEETLVVIAEAARRCFIAMGYAGAPMDQVARDAGVSTKTLYRLVPTKADLFKLTIAERIGRFMLEVDEAALDRLPFAEALERLLARFGELTLSGETIAIHKLVMAESGRFPELAESFMTSAIEATQKVVERLLARGCADGAIHLDDLDMAAGMLRGMMIMEPQRATMLNARPAPTSGDIARRAQVCVALFLRGCSDERDVTARDS